MGLLLLQPQLTPLDIRSSFAKAGFSLVYSGIYKPKPILFGLVMRYFLFDPIQGDFVEKMEPAVFRFELKDEEALMELVRKNGRVEEFNFYKRKACENAPRLTYEILKEKLDRMAKEKGEYKPWLLMLAAHRFLSIIEAKSLGKCYEIFCLNDLWNCYRLGIDPRRNDPSVFRNIGGYSLIDMIENLGYDMKEINLNNPLDRLWLIEDIFTKLYRELYSDTEQLNEEIGESGSE